MFCHLLVTSGAVGSYSLDGKTTPSAVSHVLLRFGALRFRNRLIAYLLRFGIGRSGPTGDNGTGVGSCGTVFSSSMVLAQLVLARPAVVQRLLVQAGLRGG